MTQHKTLARPVGILLAALIAAGCGAPADPPATVSPVAPTAAAPQAYPSPDPAAPQPDAYPDPAAPQATPGYPAPLTPYPAPTQGGAAPGDQAAAGGQTVPPGGEGQVATLGGEGQVAAGGTPVSSVRVVATYPHDRRAYTQGLVYIGDDRLYEGLGWYADSALREVLLPTGAITREVRLIDIAPPTPSGEAHFGEGVAVVGEQIFQLTWRTCKGFIYDRSFKLLKEFSYPPDGFGGCTTQGWGLAYDGARLIMSNGSATLFFVDPAATLRTGVLSITGQVEVRDSRGAVGQLNELELVKGELYANIYNSDWVARIDPATGRVIGYIDLSGLRGLLSVDPNFPLPEVLNGIAYDAAQDRLFVTGKLWPSLFEVDLLVARTWIVNLPRLYPA